MFIIQSAINLKKKKLRKNIFVVIRTVFDINKYIEIHIILLMGKLPFYCFLIRIA